MTQISPDTQKLLKALQEAIAAELEQKRRLGHYYIVDRDGKPVAIGEDAPEELKENPTAENHINPSGSSAHE